MYYKNSNIKEPHLVFVGRWCPLHLGHICIIKNVVAQKKLPILILVRNTPYEMSVKKRAKIVKLWMKTEHIKGSIIIIPDIEGIYYGRGVGYNIEEIKPSENIKAISATKIRELIKINDNSWEDLVANGAIKYLRKIL